MDKMTPEQFIAWLAEQFSEKRSDVTDLCNEFLEKGFIKNATAEHRFIQARVNKDILVEYDTLTTEISYRYKNMSWQQCLSHTYKD